MTNKWIKRGKIRPFFCENRKCTLKKKTEEAKRAPVTIFHSPGATVLPVIENRVAYS